MNVLHKSLCVAALSVMVLPAWALDTDDAGTVAKAGWELEVTADFARDKEAGVTSKERATGLGLTYGLTDNLDLGVGLGHVDGEGADGLGDAEIGLKWRFYEKDGLSFAIAPSLSLPTGDDEKGLGTGKVGLGLNFIASKELGDGWNVHGNAAWAHVDFKDQAAKDASNLDLWGFSAAVNKEIVEHLSAGSELGVSRSGDKAVDENPAFGAVEVVYAPSDAMEFTAGYRFGLNDVETDHTFLFGGTFSW